MAPISMTFLRFMGNETNARKYSYSLEVGGYGRKMTWEETPWSIHDSHRKVRDSHDGLVIPCKLALFFSGEDRKELKLRITGRIWKEQNLESTAYISNLCNWWSILHKILLRSYSSHIHIFHHYWVFDSRGKSQKYHLDIRLYILCLWC